MPTNQGRRETLATAERSAVPLLARHVVPCVVHACDEDKEKRNKQNT
jgi:hypothetical protein